MTDRNTRIAAGPADAAARGAPPASQTLVRGLEILNAVAAGATSLAALSAAVDMSRSTTHRLASTLVDHRYLNFVPREGYSLGPKLLELGFHAQQSMPVQRIARPYLESLSESCEDTIHLGILDGSWALYLDKIPGRRRVEISSRVGERHPVWSTGLGKALILDMDEAGWRGFYGVGQANGAHSLPDVDAWLARMRIYAQSGVALDLEENEPHIRCVAAPIRDVRGAIIAAFSVSSTAQYMDEDRTRELGRGVQEVADAISRALGWPGRHTSTGR